MAFPKENRPNLISPSDERDDGEKVGEHQVRPTGCLALLSLHWEWYNFICRSYRVCEYLYEKNQQYDKILSCYLQDPSRKPQVFYYIFQILDNPHPTVEQKEMLEAQIISSIEDIIDIDNKKTSDMLIEFFPHRLQDIVVKLESKPSVLYQLLQGLFNKREAIQQTSPGSGNKESSEINPSVQEKYIELLCQYNPEQVYSYIRGTDGYRLEETLEICRKYQVMDATAYILEKAGDVHGAFAIMLESLQKKLQEMTENAENDIDVTSTVLWSKITAELLVIIQLCQRCCGHMNQEGRESLWFPLLEAMMVPQRQLRGKANTGCLEALKELTGDLLKSMMEYVTLPAILQKIVQDPAYATGKFCEIRTLIMGMFETYNYEKTLLTTTNNLLYYDLHAQLAQLRLMANRCYSSHPNMCFICIKNYASSVDQQDVIIFKCGHSFHVDCLDNTHSVTVTDGVQEWTCYRCSHKKKQRKPTGPLRVVQKKASAQTEAPPPTEKGRSKTTKGYLHLDPWQEAALDALKRHRTTSSNVMAINELAHSCHSQRLPQQHLISSTDSYVLRLSPSPADNFSTEF